jgi:hypothetical protein
LIVAALAAAMAHRVRAQQAVDPSLFTIQSYPGVGTWVGNSLTLNIPNDPSKGFGGFVQTAQTPVAALPANIVGLMFNLNFGSPTDLSNLVFLSVGLGAYNNAGNGQGVILMYTTDTTLQVFTREISGFGGGRTTSDAVDLNVGPDYSPLSLVGPAPQNSLYSYPLFSLDLRATFKPGTGGSVTFGDLTWETDSKSGGTMTSTPEPSTLLLIATGLAVTLLAVRHGRPRAADGALT